MSTPSETKPQGQSLNPLQIPYTMPQALARYITDTGKILPRRITGLSAHQQRTVTRTIKRGRNMLTML